MTLECIFCKIIAGEIPTSKIYEDNDTIAFLDIQPSTAGHCLVIPKKHYENIIDCDELTLRRVIGAVQKVAVKVKKELNAEGINIVQNNGKHAGQAVFHIHFHVIPRYINDDFKIHYPKIEVDDNYFAEMTERLTL